MRKTMPATVFLRGKFFAVYSLHMPFYWNWTENQTGVYRNKTIIMRGFIYFKLKFLVKNITLHYQRFIVWLERSPPAWATRLAYEIAK